MNDTEISEGDDAKFDVRIDGNDLEVDWYKDDKMLDDAGRIIIEDPHPDSDDNLYSLTIENCGPEDSGMKNSLYSRDYIITYRKRDVVRFELRPSRKIEIFTLAHIR